MIEKFEINFNQIDKQGITIEEKNFREKNLEIFNSLGFPNKKLEDWKFSDFANIISKDFQNINVNLNEINKFTYDNYIKQFEHNKIVFLNGFYNTHSFEHENTDKIIFDNLKKGPAYEARGNNSLNLLNNAFFTDGLLLYVKKGYKTNCCMWPIKIDIIIWTIIIILC